MTAGRPPADICLIVEGAYPYVAGGVSTWVHDLVTAQRHLAVHLVVLVPDAAGREPKFKLPANVTGVTEIVLGQPETRVVNGRKVARLVQRMEPALSRLLNGGGRADFANLLSALQRENRAASRAALLNSTAAFDMLQRMYESSVSRSSFLNYFWTWRSLVGGLCSVLLADLPPARVYHAVSTGYAGLVMARAVLERGRPGLLTEHGIYTNERRIEIAMADWLVDRSAPSLGIEGRMRDLRDVWIDAFIGYARTCYECCDRIITLYSGNQQLQRRDGAPADRLQVVPNGIDVDHYAAIVPEPPPRRPTVALIGRVVPIKDVKTCIQAAHLLRALVPDVRVVLLGPTDENPSYHRECEELVAHLRLESTFEFAGRVKLSEHLGLVDVLVLTSLSEAQPLVLLEAGAAGIPSVATDVGSCREIIEGRPDERPRLGSGGFVTPLANPRATAQALAELLLDPSLRKRCGAVMRERAQRYYSKPVVDAAYRELYESHLAMPDRAGVATGSA